MIKANIMGNAYDLSEQLMSQSQMAQNYFSRLNNSNNTGAAQSTATA